MHCWEHQMSTLYPKNTTTREGIITNMCYSWDHAFGLEKNVVYNELQFTGGYTPEERQTLWDNMAHIYDGDIAPHHTLKG